MLNKKVKFLALLVLIISLAITMVACDMGNDIVDEVEDEPEVVEFEDSNLEEVVRDKINKPEGDILLDDVLDIEELEAPGKDIESIEGIQYLSNLKVLDLGSYYDSDKEIFKTNQIGDISPLSNLTNLELLRFQKNEVSDISPLENLTNLTGLRLEGNEVSDISPLENLTNLEWLGFSSNKVSDINPLENLIKIWGLFFNDNEVSDIGSLENLTNLSWLEFSRNEVSDISPLVENDGFGDGDDIDMRENRLDLTPGSEDMNNIQELIDRGVDVEYEPQK